MDGTSGSTALFLAAVASISTLVLSLVKIIVDYLQKGREHDWLVEQRRFDQAQRILVAADLKDHTDSKAAAIVAKIDENTAVNVAAIVAGEKAYTEANNLSLKIQQQGLQLRAPARATDPKPDDELAGV